MAHIGVTYGKFFLQLSAFDCFKLAFGSSMIPLLLKAIINFKR
ncbi:hypothetical protein M23134_00801 [Microscilla marina ATCC 23134]|uniref:Uncharacterized protein n=1 Tax=Microscilla marina ATCC 23134 TaxID=313606 RepID=A1ZVW5_MICM2|nr:hypothetical protein M23134_00801 [Microscilla marina ATCC 23134]